MIQIIYCGNYYAFKGICLSIISIVRRTKSVLCFHIFTMDCSKLNSNYQPISDSQISLIDRYIKSFNVDNQVIKHDLTNEFTTYFEGGKNIKNSYTPYSLLRLLVDDKNIIPYDKAIYLDYDIMAVNDIALLWNEDIENYEYGAVYDAIGRYWVNPQYCNSGVLLMNLTKCRETQLFVKARNKVYKHRYFMPDQTALFRSVKARKLLPRKYNEQRSIKSDTVLKHFNKYICWLPFHTVNIKQWNLVKMHKKLGITMFDEDNEIFAQLIKQNSQ